MYSVKPSLCLTFIFLETPIYVREQIVWAASLAIHTGFAHPRHYFAFGVRQLDSEAVLAFCAIANLHFCDSADFRFTVGTFQTKSIPFLKAHLAHKGLRPKSVSTYFQKPSISEICLSQPMQRSKNFMPFCSSILFIFVLPANFFFKIFVLFAFNKVVYNHLGSTFEIFANSERRANIFQISFKERC